MVIKRDVPIVLNSVSYEDSYDSAYTNRRSSVNYTLNFTAKTYLYKVQLQHKELLKRQYPAFLHRHSSTRRESRIIVVPNPTTADADDAFYLQQQYQHLQTQKSIIQQPIQMNK